MGERKKAPEVAKPLGPRDAVRQVLLEADLIALADLEPGNRQPDLTGHGHGALVARRIGLVDAAEPAAPALALLVGRVGTRLQLDLRHDVAIGVGDRRGQGRGLERPTVRRLLFRRHTKVVQSDLCHGKPLSWESSLPRVVGRSIRPTVAWLAVPCVRCKITLQAPCQTKNPMKSAGLHLTTM